MDFFDKLGESLVTAGKDVTQKAKDVSEIAKLKLDIKSKEDYVQKQYAALGLAYYEKHKGEEGIEEAEQFFLIEEAREEIERMKAEILKIQGSAECPKCGAKMPEGATFCSSCGTKMDDMYEEEE
ncbi:MAG: zinc ribbon domain-containing protein [Roseburia sp.]|nr:zinc ribbon domain-containing protein [Roseburia sp.]